MRVVKLGPADGERVAVLSGLQAGDRVVTQGTDKLKDGTQVTIGAAPGASAAGGAVGAGTGAGKRKNGNASGAATGGGAGQNGQGGATGGTGGTPAP